MLGKLCQGNRPGGKVYIGLLIGLAATVLVALVSHSGWVNHLELKLYDFRVRNFPIVQSNDGIVTIVIDDKSLEWIGRWPWPRRYLANLIGLCDEAGAEHIFMDILLPEGKALELTKAGTTDIGYYEPKAEFFGPVAIEEIDNDALLAEAIDCAGNVLFPFQAELTSDTDKESHIDEELLYQRVSAILAEREMLAFADVFSTVWPNRDITVRDPCYYGLYNMYVRSMALKAIERFSFDRRADDIGIQVYELGKVVAEFPRFGEAVANSGFAGVAEDADGVVRRIPLVGRFDGRLYKQATFAIACAKLGIVDNDIDLSHDGKVVLGGTANIEVPLDEDGYMLVSWTSDWEKLQRYVSVSVLASIWEKESAHAKNTEHLRLVEDVKYQLSTIPDDTSNLDEQTLAAIKELREVADAVSDPCELRRVNSGLRVEIARAKEELRRLISGKIVLVGSVATGAPDFFVTPMGDLTPGIVVHRNILNTLLEGDFVRRAPRWLEIAIILVLGAVMSAICTVARPFVTVVTVILLTGTVFVMTCVIAYCYWHCWLGVVDTVGVVLVCFATVTPYRQFIEGLAKRRITTRFKQYVSPVVVDRIVDSGSDVSMAGEIRELSCYFSDLAGFTSISEKLGPEKTVSVLNIYLDRMTEVLDRYSATINKFEGDGIFAFFGAPVALSNHSRLACVSALAAQEELAKLVEEQQALNSDFPTLQMRIGIGTGKAVVGDCGSHRRFDYTAIGDTVNFSARLESANKAFGSKVMVCETTFAQAGNAAGRCLGKVRVVGKTIGIKVYELLTCGDDGLSSEQKDYCTLFEKAVQHYQDENLDKTTQSFNMCLQHRPDDKAATLYLTAIEQFIANGIPQGFDGCIELTSK